VLSASRAGQASFEFEQSAGTFFTRAIVDVLLGRVVVGDTPGIIYFSELFEFVNRQVAEDLESINQPTTLQEPVFAGTFTKDPRLFILNRLSLEHLEAATPRYSRKFLQRRIRRTLTAFAVTAALSLGLYYTYLDHSRYIWHETGVVDGREGDYLSIYAGDPNLNWLGFPHRIFTTDIRVDALPAVIRPGVGKPIVSRFGLDIEPELFKQSSLEWKSAITSWLDATGDKAWRYGRQLNPFDTPDASGMSEAIESLAFTASPAHIDDLENLIGAEATASSPKALRKIAAIDPDRAIRLLSTGDGLLPIDDSHFVVAVLEGLPFGCNAATKSFLIRTAPQADDNSYLHNAWYAALLRTGCALSSQTYFESLKPHALLASARFDWIAGLWRVRPIGFDDWLGRDLKRLVSLALKDSSDTEGAYKEILVLPAELRTAAKFYPKAVPSSVQYLLTSHYSYLRVAAAEAFVAADPSNRVKLATRFSSDPRILAVLAATGWLDQNVAENSLLAYETNDKKLSPQQAVDRAHAVMQFLITVRVLHLTQARPLVAKLTTAFRRAEFRIEAFRALEALSTKKPDLPHESREAPLISSLLRKVSPGSLIDDSMFWFMRREANSFTEFLSTIGSDESEAAQVLGRSPLSKSTLDKLRHSLISEDKKFRAATVIAMRGNEKDLEGLLTSPDFNLRNQAALYASYNPSLPAIVQHESLRRFGAGTQLYLRRQLLLRQELERQHPWDSQTVRTTLFNLLRQEQSDVSPGVRLVAQDSFEQMGGVIGYGEQFFEWDSLP